MKTKATLFTMLASLANSLLITFFNLIQNNYMLQIYGSEVNGLIATLSQFVSLFLIVEGGFMTAAVVATYKPIVDKEYVKLNNILYTCKRIYIKIGVLITFFSLMGGIIYIQFIDSPFSRGRTFLLLIISVITSASSIGILSKYSVLLQGDNKEYIITNLSLISRTVTWILSMILILAKASIILVYAANIVNIAINILLICRYEKKHYSFVNYDVGKYDSTIISGTKDVMFQKIANTIFTSTDLIVTSVFISLSAASVYNLYFQIFRAVFTFLVAFVQAPFNSFGQLFHENGCDKELRDYFEIFQQFVVLISTLFLTITSQLIISFIRLYTINVLDYNYVYPVLVILFYSQMFLQINNKPYGTVLNVTGNFKMQNTQCALAAVVNIFISIFFIRWIGIHSIVLGSVIGTLVIFVMNIYQVFKKVLNENCKGDVKEVIGNYLFGLVCIILFYKIGISIGNYFEWIIVAALDTIIMTALFILVNYFFDYNRMKNTTVYIWYSVKKMLGKK